MPRNGQFTQRFPFPNPLISCVGNQEQVFTVPTYITLWNFTREGVANIKESPDRVEADRELYEEMGMELTDYFLTFGRYDVVYIVEAPDDETYTQAVYAIAKEGNATSETLKAFPEEDYRDVLAGVPD